MPNFYSTLQSLLPTTPKPWTIEESQELLHRLYVDRIRRPLEGRSTKECQLHLKAIMDPLLSSRSCEAVSIYRTFNVQFSFRELEDILKEPRESLDDDVYYGIMAFLLQLDSMSIEAGIEKVVQEFFIWSEGHQEALAGKLRLLDHYRQS